jgi:hypothetical protein
MTSSHVMTPEKPKLAGGRKILLPPIDSAKR